VESHADVWRLSPSHDQSFSVEATVYIAGRWLPFAAPISFDAVHLRADGRLGLLLDLESQVIAFGVDGFTAFPVIVANLAIFSLFPYPNRSTGRLTSSRRAA
jgi:hypothetical protein